MLRKLYFKTLVIGLGLGLGLSSCESHQFEEIARFSPKDITSLDGEFFIEEMQMDLQKGDILQLWTDFDYSYSGKQNLFWRFVILKDGEYLQELFAFPRTIVDPEIDETKVDGERTHRKVSGLNGDLEITADGNYDFKIILMGSKNPSLEIHTADLILKK